MTSAFGMWALTAALLAASIVAVLSFGLALLPLAILAGIVAARLRFWPDVFGAGLGAGWVGTLLPEPEFESQERPQLLAAVAGPRQMLFKDPAHAILPDEVAESRIGAA